MISVLTLTYQRHHLLEEAIKSFLMQYLDEKDEMVIINDSPIVEYTIDHPSINIFNCKERFSSIGEKLKWGFDQCKNEYIYRLDDDDLLTYWGLSSSKEDILKNPGYDIYRSKSHYLFVNNKFEKESGSVNNGNIYTKKYINSIDIPKLSGNEDFAMTFNNNVNIFTNTGKPTMIYRWGMNTFHISGMGPQPNNIILESTDSLIKERESGVIKLTPHFKEYYYKQLL